MPKSQASAARERLISAGIELLRDRGLDRVNSNQIARAAGVGVGTFYSHFEDKHELLRAIVLETLDALAAVVEAAASRPARDRESQVRHTVEAVAAWAEAQPDRFRVAFGREAAATAGRPAVGASIRPLERRLRGLQVQGLLDPRLHPTVAAKAFTALQSSVLIWWLEDPGRAAREEIVETLVRMHPAVVGARPAERSPRPTPHAGSAPVA